MLNHGHVGPVRFITSVEIPKNATNNSASPQNNTDTNNNNNAQNASSYKESPAISQFQIEQKLAPNNSFKTVVLTGGDGYEEYKATTNSLPPGTSLSSNTGNSNFVVLNQQSNPNDIQSGMNNQMQTSGSSGSTTGNSSNYLVPCSVVSSSYDDAAIGKEDLINYVLTWVV